MIRIKFNQPLPIVTKKIMTGLKGLLLGVAALNYVAQNERASTVILAVCLVIDFLVDTFMGEDPIITLERAAKHINEEIPNSTIKYEIHTSIDGTEQPIMEVNKEMDTNSDSLHSGNNNVGIS